MPRYAVVAVDKSGTTQERIGEYESEEDAPQKLLEGYIDVNSGLEIRYQSVEKIEEQTPELELAKMQEAQADIDLEIRTAKETGDWTDVSVEAISQYYDRLILTTTDAIPGVADFDILQIVTSETALGMNVILDAFANIRDFFGGRSGATQHILRRARETCLTEMRREALMLSADAVVGARLAYSEFSGKNRSMLFLVASGTAIRFRNDVQ